MARVLVIDDDPQIRHLLRTVLEQAHYQVGEAPDGAVGLRLFKEQRFDLVITNIFMPEKEGIETITDIRAEDQHTPVLAMSGGGSSGGTDVLQTAMAFGATATLAKPFDIDVLTARVDELLRGSASQRV